MERGVVLVLLIRTPGLLVQSVENVEFLKKSPTVPLLGHHLREVKVPAREDPHPRFTAAEVTAARNGNP